MPTKEKIWIVGPCSAESKEQVLATAQALPSNVIFRAGVWKPRTSPNTFQGAGDEALGWLQAVTDVTGLPTATEVATPEHVEKALAAGIRYLWIGARTSANPIAVQEIADAIQTNAQSATKTDAQKATLTVLIKNPVNEDVNLWLGNIQRLENAGAHVMAIHRGCNHRPCWRMAFELRRQRPDIPLLLDPSHLSGKADQVATLCVVAKQLQFDGLMIEVHHAPESALSDAQQQITPQQLIEIMNNLHSEQQETDVPLQLLEFRKEIDEVDDELWQVIAKRMDISTRIGNYKREQQIPIVQANRYDEILQRRIQWANDNNISPDAIRQIMDAIHKESVRVQL